MASLRRSPSFWSLAGAGVPRRRPAPNAVEASDMRTAHGTGKGGVRWLAIWPDGAAVGGSVRPPEIWPLTVVVVGFPRRRRPGKVKNGILAFSFGPEPRLRPPPTSTRLEARIQIYLHHQPIRSTPPPAASSMETETVGVYSLDQALGLVERRGEEEEVEVRVMGCMLREIPELREVLRERIMERHWGVVNLSRLRPFVQVDDDVGSAAEILINIIRVNYNPRSRIVDEACARGPQILARGRSLTQARMTWAQGLGRLLVTLGKVMARGKKRPAELHKLIERAHKRCRQVSERYVSTIPGPRGRNLIQGYMENLQGNQ